MLNIAAYRILSAHPHLTSDHYRLLFELLTEYDLSTYVRFPAMSIGRVRLLNQLAMTGIIEMAGWSRTGHRASYRVPERYLIGAEERAKFTGQMREMVERESVLS